MIVSSTIVFVLYPKHMLYGNIPWKCQPQ